MRANITFFLNGVEQIVSDARPDTTLLNWLRLEKGLSGTKEGCAEGDCGACTVVVTELNGQSNPASGAMPVKARAVNACILFLPMLDGLSITTVEGLRQTDGALHIVQDAIVTHHGAQCGFCTPGFVMSLYAGYENGLDDNRQHIRQILSGNLCRCTGYGALIDADLLAAVYVELQGGRQPGLELESNEDTANIEDKPSSDTNLSGFILSKKPVDDCC